MGGDGGRYGELFNKALQQYNLLCFGIYRFRDVSSPVANPTSKRYVITAPPDDFPLVSSDLVFCLMQFDYCTGHDQRSKMGNNVEMSEMNDVTSGGQLPVGNTNGKQQGNSHHYSLEVPMGNENSQATSTGQSAQIVRPIKNNIIT